MLNLSNHILQPTLDCGSNIRRTRASPNYTSFPSPRPPLSRPIPPWTSAFVKPANEGIGKGTCMDGCIQPWNSQWASWRWDFPQHFSSSLLALPFSISTPAVHCTDESGLEELIKFISVWCYIYSIETLNSPRIVSGSVPPSSLHYRVHWWMLCHQKLQQYLDFQCADEVVSAKSRTCLHRSMWIMSESCSSPTCIAMQILHMHELGLFTLTVKHSQ